MKKETELLKFIINPSFLESIKQPVNEIVTSLYYSFDINRNGTLLHITIYAGEEGQINVSSVNEYGMIGNVILRDFCKTPKDFIDMMAKVDDLIKRFPVIKKNR
jgi:hypothetical protein